MSTTVDNRIVAMKFDNEQFERKIGTSISSLTNLKKGLDLSNSAKGLDSISESAKRVSFEGMSTGLEAVRVKFSALQVIAITALANIANSAINAGRNLISSLTVDPIKTGLAEYETKMNAIQTILTNTASKGSGLPEVNAALAELNEYADKTIYNFAEMTKNIGTFTAAGVDLKTSTESIKGIANLAAGSGSNALQASTAMYQLSQAIASGSVKLMDWNSVVNAGMGGELFQKALEKTAEELGHGRNMAVSFRESLESGWITTEVLTKTLSKFANDPSLIQAATQVKTFTQLLDTMKESVQSGWAVSWEHIIGNKDEAAKTLTSINDAFGSIAGASAEARNETLKFWHDNGGRDALIEAITNAFKGLASIVKPIKEALKEVFPPMTGERLLVITNGLRDLTAKFKMSESTITNIKSTFKGLFAVLDIGRQLFLAVFDGVKSLFGGVGDLGGGILEVTAGIGEWLVELNKLIFDTNIFNNIISTLVTVIKEGFSGIKFIFGALTVSIGNVLSALSDKFKIPGFEAFHALLGVMSRRMTDVGESVGSMKSGVITSFDAMGEALGDSKIFKLLTSLWNVVKIVTNGVGDLIVGMLEKFTNAFNNADFDGLLDVIAGISIGGVALAVTKFLKSITTPLKGLQGTIDGITGILDGVRGSFEAYQTQLKAGALLKIAIAIGILTASIVAISLIDSEKLVSSLAAIGTLFSQLMISMFIFNKISDTSGKTLKASVTMIAMSLAVLILASAMKKLADLDWSGVAKGVVGITAISAALVASAKILSTSSGKLIKGSVGVIAFAIAIKILADACITLSQLSWEELIKGLIGVGILCAEITLFLNNAKFSTKSVATATGILILSGAIKVLASACKDFGSMSWSEITKGLVSIGILLAELTLFTKLTGNAKNVISTSIALVIIAASMKILASALQDFGGISLGEITKGLISMGIALTIISSSMSKMPKNMASTGAGLIIVGVALNILAVALKNMGSMSWDEVGRGLALMGGALGILSIGLAAMKGSLLGSAALIIAAGAIAILAPSLSLLGAMSVEGIVKGLASLAGVFVILGIAALMLSPLIPAIFSLSSSLVLLGVGIVGIGAGLLLVGLGLTALATAFGILATVTSTGATAIVAALSIIIIGVAALIPAIMVKLGEGIVAICGVFIAAIPEICTAIVTIVTAIVETLVTTIPLIVEGAFKIIQSVLDMLVTNAPLIIEKVLTIIISCLKVLADNIPEFVKSGVKIVVAFIKGIADSIGLITQAAFDLIISFINGLADAIRNNSQAIIDACDNLVNAIIDAIKKQIYKIKDAGVDMIKGFIKGIASKAKDVFDSAVEVVSGAVNGVLKFLKIRSPSRVFMGIGEYSGEGFVIGLSSYGDKASEAAKGVGKGAVDAMSNAIAGISDIVNADIDSNPTITPVLDLTNIQNGSKQLYGIMADLDGRTMNGSVSIANNAASNLQYGKKDNNGTLDSKNVSGPTQQITQENIFNIKGNNPKEIATEVSRILQQQVERRDTVWV